ncbi:unnamed protein product, partial [Brassica rapa]
VRQHTQDVRVCPSAHTGRPCVSVSTHRTFLAVCVCPCVSVSTHRTSVAIHHVRVCPSAHTGRPWLSISTHISTLVLGLSTLALPMNCLGDFGPRGLSVQYTQDVRECPPAHTGRPWLYVAVRQHTQDVCGFRGCPSVHISARWSLDSARWPFPWTVWVCLFSTHRTSVAVRQHTHDVSHTGRLWLYLCPCVSVSTNRTSVAVHQYTYQHVGRWTQHAGPSRRLTHRTSVSVRQHIQDVRVCPSAHTGRPWLSVCVRQHTHDVCGCPAVHISAPRWSLDSARWPFPWTVWVILAHVGCLFSTHITSVGVRQHTQDHTRNVRGCPSVHISTRWSLDSARWPFPWTVWVILAHVGCLFSTHRTSVGFRQHTQDHTQDVCGCPCVFVCVRQHTQDVRGSPS